MCNNIIKNIVKKEISNIKDNKDIKDNNITIKCKYCNSEHIKCNGNKYNKQRYYCNNCHKSFSLTDNRIKRDIKQRELCLLLYSHNVSMRSIQNIINLYFNTNISFRLIEEWIKTSVKLLSQDIRTNTTNDTKPKTIKVVEMDELYTYVYDLKKNKKNMLKYGLLLIGTEVKLFHI